MTSNILSAVYITYQCLSLDYCLEESLRASLDLCDKVYVNDGKSTDGTFDMLKSLENEYGSDRLIVISREWNHDRGFWARERNFVLDNIPEDDYVLNLGADECLHEKDFKTIRESLDLLGDSKGLQFNAVHLYGQPDYRMQGKAWARILTKIWKNSAGVRYLNRPGGCADDPLWPDKKPAHHVRCINKGVNVFHYGHARHPKKVAIKNEKAHSLYRNEKKYADGSFPEVVSYDYQVEKFLKSGGLTALGLNHPKYMQGWVEAHRGQKTSWSSSDE